MDEMPVSIPRQAGIYVRREREAQGKTRAQLARTAHVSERLLASLELGDAPGIQLNKLISICHALGLELCMRATGSPTLDSASSPQTSVPNAHPVTEYDEAWQEFMAAQGVTLPPASDTGDGQVS